MVQSIERPASYEDLLALPDHVLGEIVGGELHVDPRRMAVQSLVASAIREELGPPFRRGKGGPGGWALLDQPELHLDADIVVPDLAGWRRERMPEIPVELPYFVLAPDWVCEVLSPSTAAFDRGRKLGVYARERVTHVWFIEPVSQMLEVLRLDGETYRIVQVASGDAGVRAEPFEAIELDLRILWAR